MTSKPELPTQWAKKCIQPALTISRPLRAEGQDDGTLCERHGITMLNVLTVPHDAKKSGEWYAFVHPI
ncbi:MAG: hypothetical protein WCI87_09655, partial [Euryarchaeota archaeon]